MHALIMIEIMLPIGANVLGSQSSSPVERRPRFVGGASAIFSRIRIKFAEGIYK